MAQAHIFALFRQNKRRAPGMPAGFPGFLGQFIKNKHFFS